MRFSRRSKLSNITTFVTLLVVVSGFMVTGIIRSSAASAQAANNVSVRHITSGGTTSITSAPLGKDGVQRPEITTEVNGLDANVPPLSFFAAENGGGSTPP